MAWPTHDLEGWTELGDLCVGFQATKDLAAPVGQWQINLLPRQDAGPRGRLGDIRRVSDLYRNIGVNTVVSLGMDEPGGIMLGLVDGVDYTEVRSGQTTQVGLSIRGSDFGKVLTVDNVLKASIAVPDWPKFRDAVAAALGDNNPMIYDLPAVWGPTGDDRDSAPAFVGRGVAEVVRWALENGTSMRVPLMARLTGRDGKPGEYIGSSRSVTTWNDARVWAENLHMFNGSVWGFLNSVLDRDFYEIVLQSVPNGRVVPDLELVIRPKPYDEVKAEFAPVAEAPGITWEALRTLVDQKQHHEIAEHEVHQLQRGISDSDTASYFLVTAQHELIGNEEQLKEGLSYPLVDTFTARRFGARSYDARLALVSGDVRAKAAGELDFDGEVGAEVREFRNRLFNWTRPAPWYEKGSVTVHGRDRYRPGDPVRLGHLQPRLGTEQGLRFYATTTTHSWKYGGPYTTTLRLTRGHNDGVLDAVRALIAADAPAANPKHYADT